MAQTGRIGSKVSDFPRFGGLIVLHFGSPYFRFLTALFCSSVMTVQLRTTTRTFAFSPISVIRGSAEANPYANVIRCFKVHHSEDSIVSEVLTTKDICRSISCYTSKCNLHQPSNYRAKQKGKIYCEITSVYFVETPISVELQVKTEDAVKKEISASEDDEDEDDDTDEEGDEEDEKIEGTSDEESRSGFSSGGRGYPNRGDHNNGFGHHSGGHRGGGPIWEMLVWTASGKVRRHVVESAC
ncbi:hypothetical protein CLF_111838 [Clonorchis sinensis]|uniref:Uncharacterized protein n=1 Tax=Clonorchis sinensis TaxID=79923 RepID=G7YM19_CLOSI|nr:hypothetical protein CLF_111838 [Clonorchis sinensis]